MRLVGSNRPERGVGDKTGACARPSSSTGRAAEQAPVRRLAALAVVLVASAAVLPAASSGARAGNPHTGSQLPYRISDSFDGTSLNAAVWFTDQQSDGTSQGVQDGSLRLTASSAASSGFHDGILTRCQAVGDFDAQIRFTLSNWLAGDNVSLAVNAPNLGNTFVENAVGGDVYGLFVQPSGFITIPTSVRSRELRLSRRGDLTAPTPALARQGSGTRSPSSAGRRVTPGWAWLSGISPTSEGSQSRFRSTRSSSTPPRSLVEQPDAREGITSRAGKGLERPAFPCLTLTEG